MMRSMYSAVSSLKAHQLKMDVIGNNIANVNTVGFKGSRVTFQEVFSQTLRGAGRPQEGGRGGTNPQQVGLGINVNSMDTFHTRGAVERTDYNTDLMINGDGFFVVSDTEAGSNKSYTRAGSFGLDTDGNLITADGYYVLGYKSDGNGGFLESLSGLKISKSITSPPKTTNKAVFEGNIDSSLALPADVTAENNGKFNTVMKVYDSLGNAHNIEVQFQRANDEGTAPSIERVFNATVVKVDNEDIATITPVPTPALTKLSFNEAGKLIKINDTAQDLTAATPIHFPDVILGISGAALNGASPLSINLDFTTLKSYSAQSDAAALKINGYESGKLDDFTISTTGEIEGVFSNGEIQILGKIRLANFKNPAGLLKTGSNMYRETSNSGEAMLGDAGSGGFGSLNPGALEMSNVDLSNEFTNMITTQRGFQANSRIITTSDEMLQEIVNMKR